MTIFARASLAIVAIGLLILTACTPSETINDLQIALDAISAGLPILAGITGVPANVVMDVETYVTASNQALGQASTILSGPGTDAQKAAQITAAFAGIAQPIVPAQYAAIAALVQTVAKDVAVFLASVPSGGSVPGGAAATANVTTGEGHTTKWSKHDYEVLAHCTSEANANFVKLRGLKK